MPPTHPPENNTGLYKRKTNQEEDPFQVLFRHSAGFCSLSSPNVNDVSLATVLKRH